MYFIVAVLMFIMKYWIAFVSVKEKKRAALTWPQGHHGMDQDQDDGIMIKTTPTLNQLSACKETISNGKIRQILCYY